MAELLQWILRLKIMQEFLDLTCSIIESSTVNGTFLRILQHINIKYDDALTLSTCGAISTTVE